MRTIGWKAEPSLMFFARAGTYLADFARLNFNDISVAGRDCVNLHVVLSGLPVEGSLIANGKTTRTA